MTTEARDALAARRKLVILNYAEGIGNVKEACRDLGVSRSSFYRWKKAYAKNGWKGLLRRKPMPEAIRGRSHLSTSRKFYT